MRGFTDNFLSAVTGDSGKCLVDLEDNIVAIGDQHRVLQFKGGSGDAKVYFILFLLGDVGNETVPKHGTVRLPLWQRIAEQPAYGDIVKLQAIFLMPGR